jgi:integrase
MVPGFSGEVFAMARGINLLTAKSVAALTMAGKHHDGGGLFLIVRSENGRVVGKSWAFIYRSPVHRTSRKTSDGTTKAVGRTREMGLGPFGTDTDKVSLAAARALAIGARTLIRAGKDPLDERARAAQAPAVHVPTFGEMADRHIEAMASSWRNAKHVAQWRTTLTDHAASLRPLPVDRIETTDVLAVLTPLWSTIPETASRLRGRIEAVLNRAKAERHRTGENPAAWRGHLEHLLPVRQKLTRGHHAALPWSDVPAFVAALRGRQGVAALVLEFTILTAARSGEVRGACWSEVDRTAKVWTVPARRMKAGVEHRVPLTPRMLAILATVEPMRRDDDLVFPGTRYGSPLSDMTLAALLKRMKHKVTVHGFRSAFRDWAGSATAFPRELAEEALAHVIGSKVERAYRRQDALERRREMMIAWERFCDPPAGGNVVPIRPEMSAA